jgi:hypothetical protein
MRIICTEAEQALLKRKIKANECSPLCDHKPDCTKPKDMTCGEYIVSKIITWEVEE